MSGVESARFLSPSSKLAKHSVNARLVICRSGTFDKGPVVLSAHVSRPRLNSRCLVRQGLKAKHHHYILRKDTRVYCLIMGIMLPELLRVKTARGFSRHHYFSYFSLCHNIFSTFPENTQNRAYKQKKVTKGRRLCFPKLCVSIAVRRPQKSAQQLRAHTTRGFWPASKLEYSYAMIRTAVVVVGTPLQTHLTVRHNFATE